MVSRLSAFVIWALVAATVVFWGLRLFVRASAAPSYAVAVGDVAAVRGDLTRLLGSAPVNAPTAVATPAASSRFRLFGIMAPKVAAGVSSSDRGVALIAVDGKMPKAYAVGARLDGDLVLQSVSLRTVSIGGPAGAAPITLELPPPAAAATGTLPGAGPNYPVPTSPAPVATSQFAPQFVPQATMPPNAPVQAVPLQLPGTVMQQRPDPGAPTQ